jgi:hypothetical protein
MKTLKFILFGMMLMFVGSTQAQLSVKVHIGTPPSWGPAGYSDVRYYYLPDVEAYYDVQNSMFIYMSGNRWVHRSYLPTRYKNYDLYGGYKVVINDYRGNTPYSNFRQHKMKYAKGYRGREQRNIGQREERKNFQERPRTDVQHSKTVVQDNKRIQVRGNVKGQDHGNDNGKNDNRGKGNENRK